MFPILLSCRLPPVQTRRHAVDSSFQRLVDSSCSRPGGNCGRGVRNSLGSYGTGISTPQGVGLYGEWCSWTIFQLSPSLANTSVERARPESFSLPVSRSYTSVEVATATGPNTSTFTPS